MNNLFFIQIFLLVLCNVLHLKAIENDKQTYIVYGGVQGFQNETKVLQEIKEINNVNYSSQHYGIALFFGGELLLDTGSYNVPALFGELCANLLFAQHQKSTANLETISPINDKQFSFTNNFEGGLRIDEVIGYRQPINFMSDRLSLSFALRLSQFYETSEIDDIYKRLTGFNQMGTMNVTRMGINMTPELRATYHFSIEKLICAPFLIYTLPQIFDSSNFETRESDPSTYTFSDQRYYVGLKIILKI